MADSLCFLNILGNCPNTIESKDINRQQISAISEFYNERIMSTFAKHTASISNIQNINVETIGTSIIRNITMKQFAEILSESKIDIKKIIEDESNVDQLIESLAKISTEIKSKSEGLLSSGQNVKSNDRNEIINDIKNQFKSIVKQTDSMECASKTINQQIIRVKSGGDSLIEGVDLDQAAHSISKCIINNVMDIFNKIDIKQEVESNLIVDKEVIIESKDPATTFMSGLLKGLLKYKFIILIVVITVPGLIFLAVIIFIYFNRGSSKKKLSDEYIKGYDARDKEVTDFLIKK